MAAMKRLKVDRMERYRLHYQKLDALQIEAICHNVAHQAGMSMRRYCLLPSGEEAQFCAELHAFIEGQLERLLGE
jgi:hypothetical protein